MAFFRRGSDLALVGKVWFGEGIEGPPGHVHGGVSAYVLDEAMGCASWLRGYPTVARDIKVEFLKMTPIGQDFSIEAQVKQITRREVVVTAEIYLGREQIFSRAKGRFARLPKDRVLHFLEQSQLKVNVDQLIFP